MPKTNFCKPQSNEEKLNNSQNIYYDTEKETRNKLFVQIYDESNNYILQLMEIDTTASKIFLFLARFMESNNTIDISIKELAKIFKCSELTIKRAIKKLKEINFLTTIKVGKNNIYFLNPHIVFNSYGNYKKKMYDTYTQYAGTTEVKIEINNINTEEINNFKTREKLTYRFKLKYKEFQEPTYEEIKKQQDEMEILNKNVAELRKQALDLQAQIMINEKILKIQNEENRNPDFEDLAEDFF